MRKLLLLAAAAVVGFYGASANEKKVDELGAKYLDGFAPTFVSGFKAPAKVTAEELLGCPEGSVFAGAYSDDGGYSGFQSSDQGRTDFATKYFQHFSGCYYTVNGLRFFGFFNYWDAEAYSWNYCTDRGGINEDGDMTEAVKFEISFYKEDENGRPGDLVFTKEVDLIGEQTGVTMGDDKSGYQSIYAFDVDLGQNISLETGYLSVSAVNMGDSPSCWFSLFTASSSIDYGYIDMGGSLQFATLPMIFCLKGDGGMAAEKAVKINRLLAPSGSVNGAFEHVQVELKNAGSKPVSDACLELWVDGTRAVTENVKAEIKSLGTYKYTFSARIDCSTPGEHNFEIRNVTPGDEKLCASSYAFEVLTPTPGDVEPSKSENCDHNSISNVILGTVSNPSGATNYSDFTDVAAVIRPGEVLTIKVVPTSQYAYLAAWIDWNGNGVLGEKGEAVSLPYYNDFTAEVTIPEGVKVTEGDKLLRIITSYDIPVPTGAYDYGETEDYTITVARHAGSPALTNDADIITEHLNADTRNLTFNVGNNGQGQLTGKVDFHYILPNTPAAQFSTNDPVTSDALQAVTRKINAKGRAAAPAADKQTVYTVRYDNGQFETIGINNSENPIYGHLYPGNMLAALKGMTLTSVDVYIGDVCENSKIIIYGEKSQTENGDVITEQAFDAVADSWNHIVLDHPVAIDGTDLWVCLQVEGFAEDSYHIGIDYGPATRGFGDIINIGGNYWWSMADLVYDYNYCIRANVSGEPTPAISWMSLDKTDVNLAVGETSAHKLTLDASSLDDNSLYEAVLEVASNDELTPKVTVPVYLVNGHFSGIEAIEAETDTRVVTDGSVISVESAKTVVSLNLYTVAGALVAIANGDSLDASNMNAGVYILAISYADGSKESFKLLYNR